METAIGVDKRHTDKHSDGDRKIGGDRKIDRHRKTYRDDRSNKINTRRRQTE